MSIIKVMPFAILMSACSWVKLDQGAESVAIVKIAHVEQCKKVGTVYANTHHRLLGINRSGKKVADELTSLAKNEALSMGADTLVATTTDENGEQNFDAYDCSKGA